MDTTLMSSVVASGTTMLTEVVGAGFQTIQSMLPLIFSILVLGAVVAMIGYVINIVRKRAK